MLFLIGVSAIVGIVALLSGALNGLATVISALLKYVVGPVTILMIIIMCMKYGI